jgi:hypothetical protein
MVLCATIARGYVRRMPRWPRRLPFEALAVALLGASASAQAAENAVALDWRGPDECQRREQVLQRVEALAGGSLASAPPLRAVATVVRSTTGVVIDLTIEQLGERGARRIEAATCDQAAAATALVIAVALAPVDVAERISEVPLASAKPDPPPAPPVAELPPPPAPRSLPLATTVDLEVGFGPRLGGGLGGVPGGSLLVGGAAWIGRGWLRAEIEGARWVPRVQPGGPRPGAGVEVGLTELNAGGCAAFVGVGFALDACLAVELGVAEGAGQGIKNPAVASAPWLAVVPRLALRATDAAFRPGIELEAPVVLVRPEFEIQGFGPVYRAAPAGLRLPVGVDWAFVRPRARLPAAAAQP